MALLLGWFAGNVILKLLIEMNLQVAIVFRTDLLQQCLAVFVLLPFLHGAFVAAEVHILVREEGDELVYHVFGKLDGLGVGHVDHVG